ncbi:very short patch repair endonuclease [Roseisolibacter agri]|uniref:Very short patch repair endonuclease n=1 Tax=Roseisolibacter agri TaxID=2014610 RepID=A0AA37QID2_9BACT|nr:very short patch repair endonuclease [Roseisolibacter agri]
MAQDPAFVSRRMAAVRSTNNAAEVALRKALHRLGLRYRLYDSALPGRPDIVFASARVAVFVDGDYWHGRVLVEQGSRAFRRSIGPTNRAYWLVKIRRNVARDAEHAAVLRAAGWRVIRLWEKDVKADVERYAHRIARIVRRRTPSAR